MFIISFTTSVRVGSSTCGQGSGLDGGDANKGELEEELVGLKQSMEVVLSMSDLGDPNSGRGDECFFWECATMFIDDIFEMHVGDLFLEHGKMETVFVQRMKKGFGFIRFAYLACSEMTIKFLDRLKVRCFLGSGDSRHGSRKGGREV